MNIAKYYWLNDIKQMVSESQKPLICKHQHIMPDFIVIIQHNFQFPDHTDSSMSIFF